MNIFNFAIFLAAVAGLAMVIGGMLLIYKGAIVLSQTDSGNALNIEWKNTFRLNTQVPGLAFFIIGLLFSTLAIYAAKPDSNPITIRGKVEGVAEIATVSISPSSTNWSVTSGSNGEVNGRIFPDFEYLTLTVSAPGYVPHQISQQISGDGDRLIHIQDPITLEQAIQNPITGRVENIVEIDGEVAPVTATPVFGVAGQGETD